MLKKRGISLIVLVITIIVITILAGAVILSLSQNNPINNAKEAVFLDNAANLKTELDLYHAKQYADSLGSYKPKELYADNVQVKYSGSAKLAADGVTPLTISSVTPSISKVSEQANYSVIDGELIYSGDNIRNGELAEKVGVKYEPVVVPTIIDSTVEKTIVAVGTETVDYDIGIEAKSDIATYNLDGNVKILDSDRVDLVNQPTVTPIVQDNNVKLAIDTSDLSPGDYYIKIEEGAITDENGKVNKEEILDLGFTIENVPPSAPTAVASTTSWTSSNVTVTIQYPVDATEKKYTFDLNNWFNYTDPIVVSSNCTITSVAVKDGLQSGNSSIEIANIDKTAPVINFGTNGNATLSNVANSTVTVTDPSSGVNTLEYVWTTSTSTPVSGWTSFTSGSTLTSPNGISGLYYLWIKASDNAGNISIPRTTNTFNIDSVVPTVTYGTNGGFNMTQVSTTVSVTDPAGINSSSLQYVWDSQKVTTPSSGWTSFTNGATLTKNVTGKYYLWVKGNDNAGNLVVSTSNAFTVGIVETVLGTIQSVNKTRSGATTGYAYNNPVIPAGFVAVDTSDASWDNLANDWNNGLVIQDAMSAGNQFVWVPVKNGLGTNGDYTIQETTDGIIKYKKWCTAGEAWNSSYISDDTPITPLNGSNRVDETSQITTYGGFYVARYEMGYGVVSKRAQAVNVNIAYSTARSNSEGKYTTSYVKSGLVTGKQWDTIMRWFKISGINVETDSTSWGRYYTTGAQSSASSESYKSKNIYDLAGNLSEWTTEKRSSFSYVIRGGNYNSFGTSSPASVRDQDIYGGSTIGYRMVLYIL